MREEDKKLDNTEVESKETKNPGAARFGNFINYYQFNPPENRLQFLPKDLLSSLSPPPSSPICALDIGCNAGNLTNKLYETFKPEDKDLKILGIDVDGKLIERAQEGNPHPEHVSFSHLDVMEDEDNVLQQLQAFLPEGKEKFDVVFVFSVTMWIHLNHGDKGLDSFLRFVSNLGQNVLLEPQPWKCYQTAARRMRKLGQPEFEKLGELTLRGDDVETGILDVCISEDLEVLQEFGQTKWNRKLLLLGKKEELTLKMHGRVKVKTSAQQDEEKRLERAAKLKAYRGAMASILNNRGDNLQNQLQLDLTSRVLQSNPDIGTLWNIRREILLKLTDQVLPEGEDDKDSGEDKDKLLAKELDLTQQCLMTNPKSYGAWHHREWSLVMMDKPDWSREIGLCNKFLQLDERNFHCWDYRKMAVGKVGMDAKQELHFTMERINVNFSNYSAWHYRSKLLPLVYPDPNNARPIEEEAHNGELDLVQNAAFTDPDDSSAWFYHSWLVGRQRPNLAPALLLFDEDVMLVVTTVSVPAEHLRVTIDGREGNFYWKSVNNSKFDVMWKADRSQVKEGNKLELKIHNVDEVIEVVDNGKRRVIKGSGWKNKMNRFDPLPSENTRQVLEQELDNCNQLLDLEPSSKWTLYTKASLMSALDSQKHHSEILEILDQLMEIDYLRKGYYLDLRSKIVIEHAIETNEDEAILDLTNQKLSKIYHPEYLCLFKEVKIDWEKMRSQSAKAYLHCDKSK